MSLYTVTVLESGNRKSAVFKAAMDPLCQAERALEQALRPQIALAECQKKILENDKKVADAAAAAALPQDQNAAVLKAADLGLKLAELRVPAIPRLLADDATPEALVRLMSQQGGRIGVASPEGGVFQIMAGRYSNGTPNLDVYLKGHAGDLLRVDRIGRESESIDRPCLTVALTVQKDIIETLTDTPGFRGRGLLGRFLYAIPTDLLGRRVADPPPVPPSVTGDYQNVLRALADMAVPENPHELHLAPDADLLRKNLDRWVESQIGPGGALSAITDWAGKLVGAVVRLAGLLHLADLAGQAAPWSTPVSADAMKRAVEIGQYLVPHAQVAFGMMGADPHIKAAQRILDWVMRHGLRTFSKRDAFNGNRGFFERAAALDVPLDILAERGFIRLRPIPPSGGQGRPPSPVWEVNPLWLATGGTQNTQNTQNSNGEARPVGLPPVSAVSAVSAEAPARDEVLEPGPTGETEAVSTGTVAVGVQSESGTAPGPAGACGAGTYAPAAAGGSTDEPMYRDLEAALVGQTIGATPLYDQKTADRYIRDHIQRLGGWHPEALANDYEQSVFTDMAIGIG